MKKFAMITPHSNIFSDSLKITLRKNMVLDKLSNVKRIEDLPLAFQYNYNGNLSESQVSMTDLAYYLPEIWGMNEAVLSIQFRLHW